MAYEQHLKAIIDLIDEQQQWLHSISDLDDAAMDVIVLSIIEDIADLQQLAQDTIQSLMNLDHKSNELIPR